MQAIENHITLEEFEEEAEKGAWLVVGFRMPPSRLLVELYNEEPYAPIYFMDPTEWPYWSRKFKFGMLPAAVFFSDGKPAFTIR